VGALATILGVNLWDLGPPVGFAGQGLGCGKGGGGKRGKSKQSPFRNGSQLFKGVARAGKILKNKKKSAAHAKEGIS